MSKQLFYFCFNFQNLHIALLNVAAKLGQVYLKTVSSSLSKKCW